MVRLRTGGLDRAKRESIGVVLQCDHLKHGNERNVMLPSLLTPFSVSFTWCILLEPIGLRLLLSLPKSERAVDSGFQNC